MQFPVQSGSDTSTTEALNYLLSGPGGLGQNFQGFSDYNPAYLTGTVRVPYTVATTATTNPPTWYVTPIAVSAVEPLN